MTALKFWMNGMNFKGREKKKKEGVTEDTPSSKPLHAPP
jgi:hypothetical protein